VQKFAQCQLSKVVLEEQTLVKHGANPDISQNIIGANLLHWHTCCKLAALAHLSVSAKLPLVFLLLDPL
jgi:hypothetical protein